ncbi:uncharacterized protein CC84DRAFT_1201367 [Paraphaeosphaeria sporulosa]|uniref:Uncharacterized protein n=1 Tax=Paraphaeosphaeria sporulosa TaxID=1460663 RepID=A0A177CZR7_9PLEO|nr:uncharacterized protein CC84DRAFT_1201367 [Paraphaeosphaeria sporulosa]OAG12340.1 hypothetical protein CC84DRAFT_1201367 [Paraphaeosphaeria sporulosa]
MQATASRNWPQRAKLPITVSTRPPPERCILSQATGQPLPINPLYASALRNSLRQLSLRPPEVRVPRPIRGRTKKISKAKSRGSHQDKARRYCPSPLRREVLAEEVEVKSSSIPVPKPVGLPAPSPKILKRLIKLNLFRTKEDSAPIYTPGNMPRMFLASSGRTQIQFQPRIYHCQFARLQRAAIPERGRLLRRSLALNQKQQLHVTRRALRQTSSIVLEELGQKRDAIDTAWCKRCKHCLKHERKRILKAAKQELKRTLKAIDDSRKEEEQQFDHLYRIAKQRSQGEDGEHGSVEGGDGTVKKVLGLHSGSRRINGFSKRVLVLRGADLFKEASCKRGHEAEDVED